MSTTTIAVDDTLIQRARSYVGTVDTAKLAEIAFKTLIQLRPMARRPRRHPTRYSGNSSPALGHGMILGIASTRMWTADRRRHAACLRLGIAA